MDAQNATTRQGERPGRRAWAVATAYGLQGFGYATIVTTLPTIRGALGIDEATLTAILLLICILAAGGSVLADRIAVWRGSRVALVGGLLAQAAAMAVISAVPSFIMFAVAVAVYAAGLGVVDASMNMQGVTVQSAAGKPLLGRFYAVFTAAAALAALANSAVVAAGAAATVLLLVAAVLGACGGILGVRGFDPGSVARPEPARAHSSAVPLPHRAIWALGILVTATFVIDAAVSSWSSLYLYDALQASAAVAPLGYAVYQGAVLVTRLIVDPLTARWGRRVVAGAGAVVGIAGFAVVAAVPSVTGAILGFAATGVTVGVLAPIAFSVAGQLHPERSDEVIARVNLFNYAGAVMGAVAVGIVATASGYQVAFLLPAVLLVAALPVVLRMRAGRASTYAQARVTDS